MNRLASAALTALLCAAATLGSSTAQAQRFDTDFSLKLHNYDGTEGLDFGTEAITAKSIKKNQKQNDGHNQMSYSVRVPDGNYRVRITLGSDAYAGETTIYAESRRLLADRIATKKKERKTVEWTVHKRSPKIYSALDKTADSSAITDSVRYKAREKDYLNWDEKLTITVCGKAPAVARIEIEPDAQATTLFLCGNSTVVDQEYEPWASWGQMMPYWFNEKVCIANYAESGERTTSFMASRRLDKALSMAREGDIFIVEFGHNDEKDRGAGTGAWYNFTHNLKTFTDRIRAKGCEVVLVTPTARRAFDGDALRDTHGDYPAATKATAAREKTGLIDLTAMTSQLFNAYGKEGCKRFLVHYPAGTYPGQDKELADNTHFNSFGAYEVSKCIVMGLKNIGSIGSVNVGGKVCDNLRHWTDFNPAQPDDWQEFKVPAVKKFEVVKPDGN